MTQAQLPTPQLAPAFPTQPVAPGVPAVGAPRVPEAPQVSEAPQPAQPGSPLPVVPTPLDPLSEPPAQVQVCESTINQRVRRLSPSQFDNTVRTFIPEVDGAPSNGFASSLTQTSRFKGAAGALTMSPGQVEQVLDVSEALGRQLAAQPEFLADCMAGGPPDEACLNQFTSELLKRAFRRPPGQDLQKYTQYYAVSSQEFGHQNAVELMVRRVLVSPDFLYRFEVGGADGRLSAHELASSLSYLISDGPPDAQLVAVADDGQLLQPTVLRTQAERLLSARESGAGLESFFEQNFGYTNVESLAKDEALFPAFNAQVAEDMARETREFIAHVLWQDDSKLSTLLSAPYTVINQSLAGLYDVGGDMGEAFVKVELPPEERGGIITQPSFMSINATNERTDVVHRGLFIAEELLCVQVPAPPPEVADVVIEIDDSMPLTARDRLAQHSANPECSGCHALFDTLAFPLEQLDAIGVYRTQDNGLTIDPFSSPLSLDGVAVGNPGELARAVAASPKSGACFAEHLHDYIFGNQHPGAACEVGTLTQALEQADGNIRQAVLHAVLMPSFSQRIPTTAAEVTQ